MELQGKVALVTGGTRGIGRAIAEAFVREGASVVINGRSPEKGAQALKEMNAGDKVHFLAGDVKSREGCEALVKGTIERYGKIDILVNNAGGATGHAPVVDLEDWAMQDALVWNFWSTFWCTQYALRDMLPRQWGRIINISSVNGEKGQAGQTNYSAAKAGMHGFSMALAQELATKGVTVNTVSPGYIGTDMVNAIRPDVLEKIVATVPVKRLGKPSEIASIIAWLASEEGGYATGADFSVNGGLHMG